MSSLLLVEDDMRLHNFLVPGLRAEGHIVTVADTAQQGFDYAVSDVFDAMIFDIMLPDYSGKELCRKVRSARITTPLIFLTAMSATEDKIEGLREGADDYLAKPFDFDELLARIEALVRRSQGDEASKARKITIGEIMLDTDAFTVYQHGELIEFTMKEFQLLHLLMDSPDKVLSRTRILNKIWGYESDPLTNVVDVNIQRIRARLNWSTDKGLIRTVRGYGYKFISSGE